MVVSQHAAGNKKRTQVLTLEPVYEIRFLQLSLAFSTMNLGMSYKSATCCSFQEQHMRNGKFVKVTYPKEWRVKYSEIQKKRESEAPLPVIRSYKSAYKPTEV